MENSREIRIIGAVAAGTSAATKARRNDSNANITIYDLDSDISYSGCGLPYYIGGIVPDLSTLTPRGKDFFWQRHRVKVLTRHQVISIDPQQRTLLIRDLKEERTFEDRYDDLIIATGAVPIRPGIDGARSPHVFVLRNPADARAIRRFMEQEKPKSAAIIGAGFIGMELAENFSHAGMSVSVIERLDKIPTLVDKDMAELIRPYLEEKNVALFAGRTAVQITENAVILDDGSKVPADLVLLAVGTRPNTALAKEAGVALGSTGAIAVDRQMRTNVAHIFACGDCAESFSVVDEAPLYRPLGSTANKMGRLTGEAVTGDNNPHRGIAGSGIFRVFDLSIGATGYSEEEARQRGYDPVVCLHTQLDKPRYLGGQEITIKAVADRETARLLGVQIFGFAGVDKRLDVFATALTAKMRVQDLFHLDLSYSPPFANAKDPVHYTGMILEGLLKRDH